MRRMLPVLTLVGLFATAASPPGGAKATYVQGPCQRAATGALRWDPLRVGDRLPVGSRIRTLAKARAELAFGDGTVVRLGPESQLTVAYDRSGGRGAHRSFLRLAAGRLWAKVMPGRGQFAATGAQAVCAVTGTVFRIDTTAARTQTAVYDGSVSVQAAPPAEEGSETVLERAPQPPATLPTVITKPTEIGKPYTVVSPPMRIVPGPHPVSREAWLTIVANQQVDVGADGVANVADIDMATDAADEWVRWNREQDRFQNK